MAKDVVMFVLEDCPYCKKAYKMMDEIKSKKAEYGDVKVEIVEETKHPDRAAKYDYYYVPTFFVDGKKIHEGIPSEEAIERVYQAAIK